MHTPALTLRSAVAIAALALAGSAFAAGQEGQAGQTVSKDQRTGKIRNATAEEAKQLNDLRAADIAAQKAARQAAGAPATGVIRLQHNGIAAAFVDEESIQYSVMHRTADGKLELDCIQGKTAAESALNTPVTTTSGERQHEIQ
ncbi:MAG: post-PEP-CTERM-1 domain-containing protein [Telluria sp.]